MQLSFPKVIKEEILSVAAKLSLIFEGSLLSVWSLTLSAVEVYTSSDTKANQYLYLQNDELELQWRMMHIAVA